MPVVRPPKYAEAVLGALERAGFEAYAVGGCVRDTLLGRRPKDWDVCTSALPEQVLSLFPRTHPTGLRHGTVTVVSGGRPVEVTTFRSDGEYRDHRRPENVEFVTSLEADLMRRDFTINAMALSLSGKLCDPFGGQHDLRQRCIRCVGDPALRFNEDALRMLRALRFSAVLGFEIEPRTRAEIARLAPLCADLACERISSELQKALCSAFPQRAGEMLSLGLICRVFGSARPSPDLSPLAGLPKAPCLRWAGLCALLLRSGDIEDAEIFLRSLRLDGDTIKNASLGASAAVSSAPVSPEDWKRLSARIGDEGCRCAAASSYALGKRSAMHSWREVVRQGDCRSVSALALSGGELSALGFRGAEIGAAQSALLQKVIECPALNTGPELLKIAQELKK